MFKSINDAGIYDQGLDKGSTEIWFMRPGQSRDLGMGSKFLLKQALPLPSPDNLKGTHVLLGKIKEKDPNRIFALMQGENWSPNGEARNLVQRAGTDHTSMMQGDIMKIGDRVLMTDQGMSFYDFKKGQKVHSSVITAGRPLSKTKKTMAPHMWVISRDPAGGYLVTIGDPKKSSSKIKQSFHGTDAKDELLYWAKYNIGKGGKVAEDHVIDQTGLKLAPAEFTQWYVENIMSAAVASTLDDVAEGLELAGDSALATQVDDVASELSEFKEAVGYTDDAAAASKVIGQISGDIGSAILGLQDHREGLPQYISALAQSGEVKKAKAFAAAVGKALKALREASNQVDNQLEQLPRDIQELIDAD